MTVREVAAVRCKALGKRRSVTINDHGAAAVEFALAIVALFLFFGIYMQCVELILEHGRVVFTGFVAARTFDVKGKKPALIAGHSVDSEADIDFPSTGPYVDVAKSILIPKGLRPIFSNGYSYYTLKHSSPIFDEQALLKTLKGDN